MCTFILMICFQVFSVSPAEKTHPFSVHDMLAMDKISDPQVSRSGVALSGDESPDEMWIVFTLRKTDLQENKGRTDLWLVGLAPAPAAGAASATGAEANRVFTGDSALRQLTTHPEADTNPRWAADSRTIFFISSRSDSSQVWQIRIDGGEAQQVTD